MAVKNTWISSARVGRVDAVLLHSGKELAFLLQHLRLVSSVHKVEDLAANGRANEPSEASASDGHQTKGDKRVKGNLGNEGLSKTSRQEDSTSCTANQAHCDGEEELDAAALDAELEEGVPIERGTGSRGLGSSSGGSIVELGGCASKVSAGRGERRGAKRLSSAQARDSRDAEADGMVGAGDGS